MKLVPIGGSLMPAPVKLKSASIDRDGANPSSAIYATDAILYFNDKDNERIGMIRPAEATDGRVGLQLCSIRENDSGAEVSNAIYLWVAKDGTRTYHIDSPENFRSAISAAAASHSHSYLPLSGGTLSGDVRITKNGSPTFIVRDSGFDLSKTNNNTSSVRYPAFFMEDSAGRISCRFENIVETNGTNGFYLYARQYNTSGTNTQQKGIRYQIAKDGTGTWSIADGGSFRSSIGADAAGSRRPPNGWTWLNYVYGSAWTSYNKGSYVEFLVCIRHGANYNASAVIN